MRFENFKTLTILAILTFIGGTYKFFLSNKEKVNIFLFSDRSRSIVNIVNDVSISIIITTLLYLFYKECKTKARRNIVLPFLLISFIDIVDYFLFARSMSHIKLVLLISLILYLNYKTTKRE
jgi:hypothetical protein